MEQMEVCMCALRTLITLFNLRLLLKRVDTLGLTASASVELSLLSPINVCECASECVL